MVGGWPEADLGLRGGTLNLEKCMKGEARWNEYLKKYFTGGITSNGRHFGRSLTMNYVE